MKARTRGPAHSRKHLTHPRPKPTKSASTAPALRSAVRPARPPTTPRPRRFLTPRRPPARPARPPERPSGQQLNGVHDFPLLSPFSRSYH